MQIYKKTAPLHGDLLTDVGHTVASGARGILDLAKSARGDTADVVVQTPAPVNYANYLIYGSLAAALLYMVVKK